LAIYKFCWASGCLAQLCLVTKCYPRPRASQTSIGTLIEIGRALRKFLANTDCRKSRHRPIAIRPARKHEILRDAGIVMRPASACHDIAVAADWDHAWRPRSIHWERITVGGPKKREIAAGLLGCPLWVDCVAKVALPVLVALNFRYHAL
jgi:hypothetical protein